MPSGWDVYYVVFLAAVMALGIPLSLGVLSALIARGSRKTPRVNVATQVQAEQPQLSGRRVNTRFFLGANVSLALLTLSMLLIPCVLNFQSTSGHRAIVRGLIAVASLVAISGLGLLYASRKGDLDWLRSYRGPTS